MTRTLPYPENVRMFSHGKAETHILEHLKVAIHGQSFSTPAVLDNISLAYPTPVSGYFNIGLLHTSLTGRQGHENYAPCTKEDLVTRGYDYWALGHVHQFEIVSSNPDIVFSGCIQGRHINENGEKGAVIVSVEEGMPPVVEHRPLDVIRWEQLVVDLSALKTRRECLEQFKKNLEASVAKNDPMPVIVRATFVGEIEIHSQIAGDLEGWKGEVRSSAVSHFGERVRIEKVSVNTRPKSRKGRRSVDPGPLLELEQLVAEIKADDDELLSVGNELSALFRRLPGRIP